MPVQGLPTDEGDMLTRDDIIRMMREAALPPLICDSPSILALCEAVARRSAAAEREACAQVSEDWDSDMADPRDIAAAIRARREK
jgi:hypothetical protein